MPYVKRLIVTFENDGLFCAAGSGSAVVPGPNHIKSVVLELSSDERWHFPFESLEQLFLSYEEGGFPLLSWSAVEGWTIEMDFEPVASTIETVP